MALRDRLLFTPNFAPKAEYAEALEMGIHVTLDGLHPLRAWPEIFNGREITLRINPQRPEGHHKHVRTAGPEAKFGLHADELPEAKRLAAEAGATITGLHVHSGSGISDPDHWRRVGLFLVETARDLPDVRILDLGGGLSVDEATGVLSHAVNVVDPAVDLSVQVRKDSADIVPCVDLVSSQPETGEAIHAACTAVGSGPALAAASHASRFCWSCSREDAPRSRPSPPAPRRKKGASVSGQLTSAALTTFLERVAAAATAPGPARASTNGNNAPPRPSAVSASHDVGARTQAAPRRKLTAAVTWRRS